MRVDACAVAYRDCLDRTGAFPFIKDNAVLGHELAGTVVATGAPIAGRGLPPLSVGDRVVSLHWSQDEAWPSPLAPGGVVPSMLGISMDGGYSEYCTLPAGALVAVPRPEAWSAVEAAPVMSTYGTVWQGAMVRGRLQCGERVLVTGASGGVGTAAVQLAKAYGCHVTGVTSSRGKEPHVWAAGADEVIVLPEIATDGGASASALAKHDAVRRSGGFALCIECTGQPTFLPALRALQPEGRLVLVGNVNNSVVSLPLGLCILNSLAVIGSDSVRAQELEALFRFLDDQVVPLRPAIDCVLPLDGAVLAHKTLEARGASGRIVLKLSDDNWAGQPV